MSFGLYELSYRLWRPQTELAVKCYCVVEKCNLEKDFGSVVELSRSIKKKRRKRI